MKTRKAADSDRYADQMAGHHRHLRNEAIDKIEEAAYAARKIGRPDLAVTFTLAAEEIRKQR